MASDSEDLADLHEMARAVGLYGEWFQDHPMHPHYDLVESKRRRVVALGATEVTSVELVRRCSLIPGITK